MPRSYKAQFKAPSQQDSISSALNQLVQFNRQQRAKTAQILRKIRSRAKAMARASIQQAEEIGFSAGLHKGQEVLAERVVELAHTERECVRSANQICLALALKVTKHFINQKLQDDTKNLAELIRQELDRLNAAKVLRIVVHTVRVDSISHELALNPAVEICGSPDLELSEVRIESANGAVLLRWQERFDHLARSLNAQLLEKLGSDEKLTA